MRSLTDQWLMFSDTLHEVTQPTPLACVVQAWEQARMDG